MTNRTRIWLKGLAAAFISGISTSFLSALGITGANAVGIQIPQLTPKQLLVTTMFGGLVGVASYWKQSPVPPESTGDTAPPFKPVDPPKP